MPMALGERVSTMDRPRKSRLKRWLPRVASLFAFAVAAALLAQVFYDHWVNLKYQPPGRLIDIGGYRLHLVERGVGPVVIFEAALGGGAFDWAVVAEQLASHARTISYDRAGNGWSDPGPGSRTPQQIADELHEALKRAGISPPYVLVGHSLGGLYVQVFARRFPGEVAGMVLVDSSHPDQFRRLGVTIPDMYYLELCLAPFGAQHLFIHGDGPADYPPDLWAARKALAARSQNVRGSAYEMHAFITASVDGTLLQPFAHAIPLVVLTHDKPAPGMTSEKSLRFEHEWLLMQTELAAFSPMGTQQIVPNTSHFIPFDQPSAIVNSVNQVLHQTASSKLPNPQK